MGYLGFSPILLYIVACYYVQAGPVIRPSRMVREIYPEVEQEIADSSEAQGCMINSITYPSGSPVPADQPCLQCVCLSGSVTCIAEQCSKQPGCRAVHQPGQCCASYTCECNHSGRLYANGERLPQTPGAECSVCYCRGGHVQCAEVGCYTRSDCEARYVKGECCPKYDHCPPRDPLSDRIIGTSPSVQNLDVEFFSRIENTSSSFSEEGSGDDDVILGDEPRKSSTPITFSIKEIESKSNSKRQDDRDNKVVQNVSDLQITIQEVFVPQNAVSVRPVNPVTMLVTKDSNSLADVESYASEKTEVYDHPPPVLRIGDQLLFVKQGQLVPEKDASTPSPVITLIGAEGLQIGLGSGELILPSPTTTSKIETTTETFEESSTGSSSVEPDLEYIPEENPYYPPIPEDIMNIGQDEVTTETAKHPKDPYKITIPLINEKAALPESLLSMTAPSDSTTEDFTEDFTVSNEDASVELIHNDSSSKETSDLVEILPGFEDITEKTPDKTPEDVELIDVSDKMQKRDVVKKVLKDTFDNPKENIRTDLIESSTQSTQSSQNEEQNIVRLNHDLLTRSLNSSKISTEKEISDTQFREYHNSKLAD